MTNLEIAQSATLREIGAVADAFGLPTSDYEPLGRYKGKLTYEGMARLQSNPKKGKLVLVTAINPTPAGEGKTTVTIGLTQGLNRIGAKAISATREPALGPIFGVKGVAVATAKSCPWRTSTSSSTATSPPSRPHTTC